jgi:uncharacterized protein
MSTITGTVSNEKGMTVFIKRHPILSVYLIMFIVAWSVMIPQSLYSQGLIGAPLPEFLEILTGWIPGIAAVLVSGVIAGRDGVRQLLRRFLVWKVGVGWYLFSTFLLAGLILGGIGLHVLFGGDMPVIPAADSPLWQTALIFIVFVLLGFLINTEEVVWRGFALPRLQTRYGVLIAALLITVPEVMLHLPLFWVKENPFFQTVGIYWFSAFSVAAVFIYIYVFNKTKGSLLLVTLMHASQNAWSNLLSDNSARPFYFTVILTWAVALVLIAATKGQLGYQPDISE